jgi:hypothetical protein
MIKKNKIPTILGIIILLVGVFAGVALLSMNQVFKIGASASAAPKDVRISNLTDTSATISWITEGKTVDFVTWGENQETVNKIEKESETDQKFATHSINLTNLKANTSYFYKINSDGSNFDNNGIPWQFTTGSQLPLNQNSIPISGSVINATGQPSVRALVYVTVNGYLMSTLTSDSGSFVLQLGNTRSSDLTSYTQTDPAKTLLSVSVQAEGGEVASAQIFPQSANPIPPLILGQTQDYRNLQPTQGGQNPNVNLNLPTSATQESKFNVATGSADSSQKSVILESLDEGETVTSTQPQFFGKGPPGETITITVHSDQVISQTIQIPKNGSWSWSPPNNLSPGAHSITVSWIDTSGITRTLTRDFIVQAGEAPAFVASPSGSSPTPTPTSTPTPSPTLKATPSPTPTISATPTPAASASAQPGPVTGNLTPTILLSIMGIAVTAFGVFVWKTAET